jgi:hypothetical protein
MYARSLIWKFNVGFECLDVVPSIGLPIGLVVVSDPEPRDIKVLEEYIDIKKKHIACCR